jgi:cytochrome c553
LAAEGVAGGWRRELRADAAYLARQLKKVSSGMRAYDPRDAMGAVMRAAIKGLSDVDMQQLSSYYSNVDVAPRAESTAQSVGAKAAEDLYLSTCAPCHGLHAQGYPQLEAPDLNILDRGHIARQLESFVKGWLGNAARSDQQAVRMRSIPTHVSSPRELSEVIQYIGGQWSAIQKH